MKINWTLVKIWLLLVALNWSLSTPAHAATLNPTHDALVQLSMPDTPNNGMSLGVLGNSVTTCDSTGETYLKFDLSSVSQQIDSATLTFRSTFTSGSILTMELRGATGSGEDNWDEATLTWNSPKPNLDATGLGTASLTTVGNDIIFGSNSALVNFLENERSGDGVATLGIVATACGSGTTTQGMSSKEGSVAPVLDVSPPLAANLASFTAISQPDHVLVDWQTVAEQSNLGFNLLRSTSAEGEQVAINTELIPSQAPGSGQGASYSFEDSDVEDGTTYFYWLQDVDTSGTTGRHGPVSLTYESNATAVDVSTLGAESRWGSPWANGLLGTLLLAAGAGYVWHRRRRV